MLKNDVRTDVSTTWAWFNLRLIPGECQFFAVQIVLADSAFLDFPIMMKAVTFPWWIDILVTFEDLDAEDFSENNEAFSTIYV